MYRLAILTWFFSALAFGQGDQTAKTVYNSSQESVFLIYLNDSTGNATALGSGFLVAPNLLITNAHVVEAGEPVLAVGPVRLPLKVIHIDKINDLALLHVDASLTSKPLSLSQTEPSPGEQIFAIGNPEGLEKTISQGIVSGLRKSGGREVIQITSPISHGSSGGPILNGKGEVVGVAVEMIENGQNLNFAVPVAFVRSIMAMKSDDRHVIQNPEETLAEARSLLSKRQNDTYSGDPQSDYQTDTAKLLQSVDEIIDNSTDSKVLTEVACMGTRATELSDSGIDAARKLLKYKPSAESQAILAYVLWDRSVNESFTVTFSPENSDSKVKAKLAAKQFADAAENAAKQAAVRDKGNALMISNFVLANLRQQENKIQEAITLHSSVIAGRPHVCGADLASMSYDHLFTENQSLGHIGETERLFREYASEYEPTPWEWDNEGDRRSDAKDPSSAAEAYEKAATSGASYGYDSCYAAAQRYLQPGDNEDAILKDGRQCLQNSVQYTGEASQKQYKSELPIVYKLMAETLEHRGVHQQALEYIKESLALNPEDAFSLNDEATILDSLERYSECIAAATAAVQASDGKYEWMHFRLGSCYFSTENWTKAEGSFRLSAKGDPTDAVSAFNLGLSLERQGYESDAQGWFKEALKRKPDSELREKLIRIIR